MFDTFLIFGLIFFYLIVWLITYFVWAKVYPSIEQIDKIFMFFFSFFWPLVIIVVLISHWISKLEKYINEKRIFDNIAEKFNNWYKK